MACGSSCTRLRGPLARTRIRRTWTRRWRRRGAATPAAAWWPMASRSTVVSASPRTTSSSSTSAARSARSCSGATATTIASASLRCWRSSSQRSEHPGVGQWPTPFVYLAQREPDGDHGDQCDEGGQEGEREQPGVPVPSYVQVSPVVELRGHRLPPQVVGWPSSFSMRRHDPTTCGGLHRYRFVAVGSGYGEPAW